MILKSFMEKKPVLATSLVWLLVVIFLAFIIKIGLDGQIKAQDERDQYKSQAEYGMKMDSAMKCLNRIEILKAEGIEKEFVYAEDVQKCFELTK